MTTCHVLDLDNVKCLLNGAAPEMHLEHCQPLNEISSKKKKRRVNLNEVHHIFSFLAIVKCRVDPFVNICLFRNTGK